MYAVDFSLNIALSMFRSARDHIFKVVSKKTNLLSVEVGYHIAVI